MSSLQSSIIRERLGGGPGQHQVLLTSPGGPAGQPDLWLQTSQPSVGLSGAAVPRGPP